MESQQSNITKKIIGGAITLGVIAGVASLALQNKTPDPATVPPRQDTTSIETLPESDDTDTGAPTPSKTTTSQEATKVQSTTYTDGTYSATGTYKSPAGTEDVSVTLVIQNDTVLSSKLSADSNNSTSKKFQKQFSDGYLSQVIGKKLIDLKVGKVSGSSLTGKGFNDAVIQIQSQAKI
jgi:uncharacterized protein with FMN-binding domain